MNIWGKLFTVALAAVMAAVTIVIGMALANASNGGYTLTVDGTAYAPTKIVGSGPTVHYYTPGTTPSVAYTERHTWTHHGSDNLPCDGVLHWIDNANVLVISHCESETGTTTTSTPTTTTSLPEVTTTTQVITTTTTTKPTTTTTAPTTSTTVVGSTTTTTTAGASTTTSVVLCGKDGDAPCGGVATGDGGLAAQEAPLPIATCNGSGAGMLLAGGLMLLLALVILVGAWWRARTLEGGIGY